MPRNRIFREYYLKRVEEGKNKQAASVDLHGQKIGWDIFNGSWEAYEAYGEPLADIEWINTNLDKTVETVLKSKKGSIKNAPKKPGDPDWQVILGMTLREIQELAQKGDKGFGRIYKLLIDGRFNK